MNAPTKGFIALLLVAATACNGDEGSGPAGPISISASPVATTLSQGGTGTVSVTVARVGGFADPVAISVNGLPNGVSATVTPAQLTPASAQALVTFTVSEDALPGSYTVTVNATANGVAAASATYSLIVTPRPSFALRASPSALSAYQGESATSDIQIERTSFSGAVSLTLLNSPAGITGQFASSSATGSSAALTVQVADHVSPGTYALTVLGSAVGFVDRTASLTITVTQRPDYSLSLSPANVAINVGSSAQVTVNVNRTNFAGVVDLELQSLPTGFSGTFGPPAAGGSPLTISVAGSVVPGTYSLTIRGRATGFPDKSATLAISVAPQPDYALSVTPAGLTISSGATGQVTVNIQRTNFTGIVNLSLDSAPVGILPSVNPVHTTGSSAALSITVASTVTPGSYNLTIKGATDIAGAMDRSTTLALTVTAPPPPGPTPPPPPPAPAADFTVSVSPTTVSTAPGTSVTAAVTVTWITGIFDVTLELVSPSSGITAVVGPRLVGVPSQTLTISVAANVVPGTYPVTVQGTGGGQTRTAAMTVVVTLESVFTLSMVQPGVTVPQNTVNGIAVQINRINFPGAVSLSLENAPPGVTGSFVTNPTTGTIVRLNVTAQNSAPLGTYTLTVRGTAPGHVDQTTTFQLNVVVYSTFSISASPASFNTYKGGSYTSTISAQRINWPHDIALSLPNVPAGVSASLSHNVLSGSTPTSSLTFTIAPDFPGTGGLGISVRAQSDTLVTYGHISIAIWWAQIFYLSSSPQFQSITQGSSGSFTVHADRITYDGPITLAITGTVPGMTLAISSNPFLGASATVTINVDATVPVGSYTLNITGTGNDPAVEGSFERYYFTVKAPGTGSVP